MRPLIKVQENELGPVIASDALGYCALRSHASKDVDDLRRFESVVGLQSHALAAKDIDYGQSPIFAPSASSEADSHI